MFNESSVSEALADCASYATRRRPPVGTRSPGGQKLKFGRADDHIGTKKLGLLHFTCLEYAHTPVHIGAPSLGGDLYYRAVYGVICISMT